MRIAAVVLLLVSAAVFIIWASMGADMVTKYQTPVSVVETDDFGDRVERTELRDEFTFGLLPDKGYDGALPLSGIPLGLGLGLLVVDITRRRRRQSGTKGA